LSEPISAKAVERTSSESWHAAVSTMQGFRRTHEDAHVLACSGSGSGRFGVFAVLDGHGGSVSAHVGSRLLEEHLSALARRGTMTHSVAEAEIQKAFIAVDVLLRQQLPPEDSSGSTVVAAMVTETGPSEYCIQLIHSGDSRAVLCTGKGLVATDDHKPGREDETRRIRAAGGTVETGPLGGGPLRVDGALAVSRALGDFRFKPADLAPERCKVTVVPEVQTVMHCKAGDWLLLACDGIFDVMENKDVYDFISARLKKAPSGQADGGAICSDLISHVVEKGSKDNCTALLVQFLPPGKGKASAAARELIPGPWRTASAEIQAKYADFFEAEGFEAEGRAIREALPPPPAGGGVGRGRGGPPGGGLPGGPPGGGGGANGPQLMALAKALQAMRSSRSGAAGRGGLVPGPGGLSPGIPASPPGGSGAAGSGGAGRGGPRYSGGPAGGRGTGGI